MGNLNFQISAKGYGFEQFDELKARVADLSPAYKNIIELWAKHNLDKFARGMGKEATGADEGSNVWWAPLVPGTMKAKRRAGYPDSLMVATGSLKAALTDQEQFAQFVSESMASFGMPLDEDDAKKVGFNWTKRPTVFLDQQDRLAIQREITNYLNLGPEYPAILGRYADAARMNAQMDAELEMMFNG